MASFDIAIALSQSELNQAVATVYKRLFPKVFSGSIAVGLSGISAINWSIASAPLFNLAPASLQSAATAIAASVWQNNSGSAEAQALTQEDVHSLVSNNMPAFAIDFPLVNLSFVPDNGQPIAYQLANVCASCYVRLSGSTISFVTQSVTCDPLPNPSDQFFVKLMVLPAIQNALQSLLSGLTIPPISFSGISLTPPSIAIVDQHIVAAVNIASKGIPAPAPGGTWTGAGFSLLLSRDILQAAAAGQGKNFGSSGSGGDHWGGYDWHYSLSLVNPSVDIRGNDIAITFALAGSVGATAYVLQIPIGLSFDARAVPSPTAVCTLQPRGKTVEIVTRSVSPFTVLVTPSGGIPSKIAGWIVEGIVQAVVASVSPIISQFLGGITFASVDIPSFSENVEGVSITLSPVNMMVSNVNGCIALGGNLAVS